MSAVLGPTGEVLIETDPTRRMLATLEKAMFNRGEPQLFGPDDKPLPSADDRQFIGLLEQTVAEIK